MHSQKHHDAVVLANHRRKGKHNKSSKKGYVYVNNGIEQHHAFPGEVDKWIAKGYKLGGLPKSKSHRANISKGLKKYVKTPEHCLNISIANSGENHWCYGKSEINPMKGRHQSDKAKHLISLAMSGENHPMHGKHLSNRTRKLISKSNKGRKLSKDARRNLSKSHLGLKQSEATCKKRSISMSRAIANSDKGKFQSIPERECIAYLKNYFLVIPQYRIKGSGYMHPYDIYVLLPNGIQLLIEFDGNYWHKDTDYKNDIREQYAALNGYAYVVLKESDYRQFNKLILKEIIIYYCPEVENYHLKDANLYKSKNIAVKPIKFNKDVFLRLCN